MKSSEPDDPLAVPEAAELRAIARGEGDDASPPQTPGNEAYEAFAQRLAAEEGPAARAKSLSTGARVLLASAMVVGLGVLAGIASPRPDIAGCPISSLLLTLGSTGVLIAGAVVLGFRPLHRPPLASWALPSLVGVTAATLAILYVAFPLSAAPAAGVSSAITCAGMGSVAALPLLGLLALLDRGGGPGGIALAAGAGAGANTTLLLHCGDAGLMHMLAGHVMVVLIVTAGYVVGSRAFALARRG